MCKRANLSSVACLWTGSGLNVSVVGREKELVQLLPLAVCPRTIPEERAFAALDVNAPLGRRGWFAPSTMRGRRVAPATTGLALGRAFRIGRCRPGGRGLSVAHIFPLNSRCLHLVCVVSPGLVTNSILVCRLFIKDKDECIKVFFKHTHSRLASAFFTV